MYIHTIHFEMLTRTVNYKYDDVSGISKQAEKLCGERERREYLALFA